MVAVGACALLLVSSMSFIPKAALVVLIAALYFRAFFRTKPDAEDTKWRLHPDTVPDAIIVSDLNGKLLNANLLAKNLFSNFNSVGTITALFDPWHSGLNERKPADDVVSAALAAPDFHFSETLHFQDGRTFERMTRVGTGETKRIWILRDISHLQQASHDSEMHTTMIEADAARTAKLAEQLYHAKSEMEAQQAELTRLANTDSLTGLLNRRRFTALGEGAIQRSKANSIFIIMMDIDHFKRINDTYGHAAGDMAIRNFAAIAENMIGDHGFLGRMGGEEFAAVLENINMDGAIKIAEATRKAIASHTTEYETEKFRFTISVGVAEWQDGETSIEAALDRSDQALYSAKSYGRNRVVGFEKT